MPFPPWKTPETYWDVVVLNGTAMPGLANVETSVERSVQLSSPKGSDGLTLANNGYKGAKVRCRFRMWEDEQIFEFLSILPEFHPREGGTTNPVQILSPSAHILGVSQIYITKWRVPTPDSAAAYFTPEFEAVQWFPAPVEVPKPVAPGGGGRPSNGRNPDPEFRNPKVPPINPATSAGIP